MPANMLPMMNAARSPQGVSAVAPAPSGIHAVAPVNGGRARISASPQSAQGFAFVDNVRFCAMLAVVVTHAKFCVEGVSVHAGILFSTPFKFGTIGFFLVSGFLMGNRFAQAEPVPYLQRRLKNVFVPWLCWLSLTVLVAVLSSSADLSVGPRALTLLFLHQARLCLMYSPFWFVPNLLLGITLLLLVRRSMQELWLGVVLGCCSVFYAVNIYGRWLPTSHLEALLGFVSYLWLGAFAAAHYDAFCGWMQRVRTGWLVGLVVLTGVASLGEAEWLAKLGSSDPLNTLRISNQLFSVACVLLIFTMQRSLAPRWMKVRRYTFGIYLTHWMLFGLLTDATRGSMRKLAALGVVNPAVLSVAEWFVLALVVYGGATLLVSVLSRQAWLGWSVGGFAGTPETQPKEHKAAVVGAFELIQAESALADGQSLAVGTEFGIANGHAAC